MVEKPCPKCGKPIREKGKAALDRRVYCSQLCNNKFRDRKGSHQAPDKRLGFDRADFEEALKTATSTRDLASKLNCESKAVRNWSKRWDIETKPVFQVNRFWSFVDKDSNPSHWMWTGRGNHQGYGNTFFDGHTRSAARVAWDLVKGEKLIPGTKLVATCEENYRCCNPDHREVVWDGGR